MTPLTQKVTSNLSGGCGFGVNRVRIDSRRIWLYFYDRCHAPTIPRRPSDSIAPGFCCLPSSRPSWTAAGRAVEGIVLGHELAIEVRKGARGIAIMDAFAQLAI